MLYLLKLCQVYIFINDSVVFYTIYVIWRVVNYRRKMDENQTTAPSDSSKNLLIIGSLVLIAIVALVYFLTTNGNDEGDVEGVNTQQPGTNEAIFEDTNTDQENPEPNTLEEAIEPKTSEFEIEAKSFSFTPAEMVVQTGDTVRITITNTDGVHDFVIDELSVRSAVLQEGETEVIEFTVDAPGTYEYYCSVGNHRSMGMVGTLIVE